MKRGERARPRLAGNALLLFGLTLAGLGPVAGCGEEKSYAVVTVRASEGELAGTTQFVVYVSNGPNRYDVLEYPAKPAPDPFRLTPVDTVDFSVSFTSSYVGPLRVGVEARNTLGDVLGYGMAEKSIDPGHRIDLDVAIRQGDRAPPLGTQPIATCEFLNAPACGAGKTCVVDCQGTKAGGICAPAGTGKDGSICTKNEDCEPGTQCFLYGCARVCRRFCNDDAQCPQGKCNRQVECMRMPTEHRLCSQTCDPRPKAPRTCPTGLDCLLFSGEESACECRGDRRIGKDGMACVDTRDCEPGLMCVAMGGPTLCRPICKRATPDCDAGRTCTELRDPRFPTLGACVPG